MAKVKLPINTGSNKDIDEIGLGNLGAELRDAYVDELGNVHKRPGLEKFSDVAAGNSIDGLFWWPKQELIICVTNGTVYTINQSGTATSRGTVAAIQSGTQVSFANMDNSGVDTVYMANGGEIFKIVESTYTVSTPSPANAPTVVTQLVTMDDYLIAIDDGEDQVFAFSNPGAPETWDADDFASLEVQTDKVLALGTANSRLYFPGQQTLEVWKNDGVSPFIKEFQGFIARGIIAKYSFTFGNGIWYWLDNNRQVVAMIGNQLSIISTTMNKQIQGYQSVDDAIGNFMVVGGRPYYILTFPTEGATLAYDVNSKLWLEWGTWDGASYGEWKGRTYALAETWNIALVGDKANGVVYKVRNDFYVDDSEVSDTVDGVTLTSTDPVVVTVNGHPFSVGGKVSFSSVGGTTELNGNTYNISAADTNTITLAGTDSSQFTAFTSGGTAKSGVAIRTLIRTGHMDHGSNDVRKRVNKLTLRFKRSQVASDVTLDMAISVRWRDNGSSSWQNARTVPLDSISDTDFRAQLYKLGWYYSRQYEFTITSAQPLVFSYAEEDVDALVSG